MPMLLVNDKGITAMIAIETKRVNFADALTLCRYQAYPRLRRWNRQRSFGPGSGAADRAALRQPHRCPARALRRSRHHLRPERAPDRPSARQASRAHRCGGCCAGAPPLRGVACTMQAAVARPWDGGARPLEPMAGNYRL